MLATRLKKLHDPFTPEGRVRFFVVLAVLFAMAFGITSWRTARVARRKVEFVTCSFAVDASRILMSRSRYNLDAIANPIFAAVGGRAPVAATATLADPAALKAAAHDIAVCRCAPRMTIRGYFRLDFNPDGTPGGLIVEAADSGAVESRLLTVVNETRTLSPGFTLDPIRLSEAVSRVIPGFREAGVIAAAVTNSPSDSDALQAVAVLSPKYSMEGSLRAVYGFIVVPTVFAAEVIAPVFDRETVFPWTLAMGSGYSANKRTWPHNYELANFAIVDARWTTLYQTGPLADTAMSAPGCVALGGTEPGLALMMLHVSPRLQVYNRWVQNGLAESYLPFLAALVLAMLASVVAAVLGAQREAELARLRSDFVSSASHELRMPLAQILLSGETLRAGRTRSQAEHNREANSIVREAHRLTGLVENALFFSRIEHHNLQIVPQLVPLHDFVADTIAGVQLLAKGCEVTMLNAVPPALCAPLDTDAFRQVLFNLFENAIKYGPPGQEIVVGADASTAGRGQVCVWVEDEGPGVPPRDSSRVFQPFVRLDRDRNVGIAGSGLGLAVVKHLVDQHGGRVWIEPGRRGVGSRFVVELPGCAPGET
jgi:signal transduction histidine kinase